MSPETLRTRAGEILQEALRHAPPDLRNVHLEQETTYCPDIKRRISDHRFSVLAQGTPLVVFFDRTEKLIGWRDDGRAGSPVAVPVIRERLLAAVVEELALPGEAWLGDAKSVLLPPVGWTHQATVFLRQLPTPEDVLRVWVDPIRLRLIQCLNGAEPQP